MFWFNYILVSPQRANDIKDHQRVPIKIRNKMIAEKQHIVNMNININIYKMGTYGISSTVEYMINFKYL